MDVKLSAQLPCKTADRPGAIFIDRRFWTAGRQARTDWAMFLGSLFERGGPLSMDGRMAAGAERRASHEWRKYR